MSTAVLLFQLCVIASLWLALHFGNRRSPSAGRQFLLAVAVAWTLETLMYVFTPPLMVLQLVVVWGGYAFLSRPKQVKSEPVRQAEPTKPAQPAKPVGPARPPAPRRVRPPVQWARITGFGLAAVVAVPAGFGLTLWLIQAWQSGHPAFASLQGTVPRTYVGDRSYLIPQPTFADTAYCATRGTQYFRDIGSYPKLTDGRDAIEVAWERCRSNVNAFPE